MSRWLIDPVNSSRRSASVDFPWSMWAMMQKFRTSLLSAGTEQIVGRSQLTLLVLGVVLVISSYALILGRDFVIRRVTSQPLGWLPPGYAATRRGYLAYTFLVFDLGLILLAINFENPWLILGAIGLFVIASITVIVGEVVTYRNLKR